MEGDSAGCCEVNNDDSEIIVEFNPLAGCNVCDEYDIIDDDAVLTTACSRCGVLDASGRRQEDQTAGGPREVLNRPVASSLNQPAVSLPRINCAEKIVIILV